MAGPDLRTRLYHAYFLFRRPMTLGVRVFLRDPANRILMVRHGYVAGWHLPGGGVEREQTAQDAARRELREETGIEALGELSLFGVYANRKVSRRDHVIVFTCSDWRQAEPFVANREIVEIGFFDAAALPDTTSAGTRARIGEILSGRQATDFW